MKIPVHKKTIITALVTTLFTGFTLASDDEKVDQDQKDPEVESEVVPQQPDLGKLIQELGIGAQEVELMAESLKGESGQAMLKMGTEILGQMMAAESNGSPAPGPAPAPTPGTGITLSSDGNLTVDLSRLLAAAQPSQPGAPSPRLQDQARPGLQPAGFSFELTGAIISPNGVRFEFDLADIREGILQIRNFSRGVSLRAATPAHQHSGHHPTPSNQETDQQAEETAEVLRAISAQMDAQTKLLIKLVERLDD